MILKSLQNPQYSTVTIQKIIEEAPGVKTFVLEVSRDFSYKAGQFLTFVFEDPQGEQRRSYSFSSSPEADDEVFITVKRVTNGQYSRPLIDDAQIGDRLTVSGVSGQFVVPDNSAALKQIFFFAAGIGITPVFSLIKTLLVTHPHLEIVLVYSNPSALQTVFYQQLLSWQQKFPARLKLEFLFSSSANLARARLSKWLLPQLLKAYVKTARAQHIFYTCGPFTYMRMVTLALEEQGYTSDFIKKENFDTRRPAFKIQPPDKEVHTVVLRLKNKTVSFNMQYPQTILQAAKENGIQLPYSCETGRCGSCIMRCTSGKIWMSYNEVLTEKEVAQGSFLTCVGYPVEGDVVLENA